MSMKKLLIGAIAATILFSTFSASHAQSTFADVPDNHWAAQAVKRLAETGIMVGRPVSSASKAATSSTRIEQKSSSEISEEMKHVVWGKAVNGLQAGTSAFPMERDYVAGDFVSFTYHIRNVSKKPVKLAVRRKEGFFRYEIPIGAPGVLQLSFAQTWLSGSTTDLGYITQVKTLAPNEICNVPAYFSFSTSLPFEVRKEDRDRDIIMSNAPRKKPIALGKYKVKLVNIFSAEDVEAALWVGQLETKEFLLNVVAK